ncbi:MAG: Trk system potassium transporter TrkA [bacterium]
MRIIIVGAGEVGRNIASRLSQEAKDVVLIDQDEQRIRAVREALDVQALVGSGSNPRVLTDAGIVNAEMLIAVTDRDEVNLTAALITAAYSPNTIKIARIRSPDLLRDRKLLEYEGLRLDLAINPERVAAEKIHEVIRHPWAADLVSFADGRITLVGVRLRDTSPIAGAQLKELPQRVPGRVPLIVAVNRGSDVVIPTGGDRVEAGDLVYVVARSEELDVLAEVAGHHSRAIRSVLVGGASRIGLDLARMLEEDGGYNVKLLEPDQARCRQAAEALPNTIVILGSITDQELLRSEGIDSTDMFVAVSSEEELNILAALLAKRLGASKVVTVSNRLDYRELIATIGVDALISPRTAAVGSIMHYIRRGRVLRVTSFGVGGAEAIEFEALPTSDVVGKPLKEVKFPRGAIIGAVVRDEEVVIPRGDDVINAGDRVLVFTLQKAVRKVERAMSVRLEFF